MRLALLILFLATTTLRAAVGDVFGMSIDPQGWFAHVWINGLSTNGTFAYGLGTNNSITGAEKLVINLTSQGFDNTGMLITRPRTIYGTKAVRFPYPSQAHPDTIVDPDGLHLKIALSDFVYLADSNLVATVGAGLYTGGGANNAAASVTVTNASTQNYSNALPIVNWSWPGWQIETNSTMRLRAVGFHRHGFGGNPLAALKFIATDESGDAVTNIQTAMQIDRTLPDIWGTGEYVADISMASFTAHDQIRCDFIAYPWIGNATSVLDTTLNAYSYPLPSSITNLCDKNNNFSGFVAVVERVAGSDVNGRATNVAPASVNSAHYFATLTAAWNSLTASNNANAATPHNNPGGGVVYIRTTGTTNIVWTSGTLSAGSIALAKCWAETTTYPGDTQAVITNRLNDRNIGHRTKLTNIEIDVSDPAVPFNAIGALWLNDCRIDSAGTAFIQSCTNVFVTHSDVPRMAQGLKAFSTQNVSFSLLRGNNLDGFNNQLVFYTAIGNFHPTTNGSSYAVLDYATAMTSPNSNFRILYNNYFGGTKSSPGFIVGAENDIINGMAIVQNVFEACGSVGNPLASLASSGNRASTNIIVWNNVFTGERIADVGSSGAETATIYRFLWSVKNNISDLSGFKKDYDAPADADRVGNWSLMWQAGGSGNMWVECRVNSAVGAFPPDFTGLVSSYPNPTNIINYPQYVSRLSYAGDAVASPGGGNYRLLSYSPGVILNGGNPLPFDLEGNHRGGFDPPGAYSSASPRKGGGFF